MEEDILGVRAREEGIMRPPPPQMNGFHMPDMAYCKRGNIRGTLIFADFAVFQQARIQKPAKIFAIFCHAHFGHVGVVY